jgi:hypothetical protein
MCLIFVVVYLVYPPMEDPKALMVIKKQPVTVAKSDFSFPDCYFDNRNVYICR